MSIEYVMQSRLAASPNSINMPKYRQLTKSECDGILRSMQTHMDTHKLKHPDEDIEQYIGKKDITSSNGFDAYGSRNNDDIWNNLVNNDQIVIEIFSATDMVEWLCSDVHVAISEDQKINPTPSDQRLYYDPISKKIWEASCDGFVLERYSLNGKE